jgi:hypothetical protein
MAHLLLWMAGCALFLSIVRQLADVRPGPLGSAIVVAASLGPGAAWAGLLVLIGRWLRGSPWPVQPGHWLLAILGARLALDAALRLMLAKQPASSQAIVDAVTCCLLVLPTLSQTVPALWKVFFSLLVLLIGAPLALIYLNAWFGLELGPLAHAARAASAWSGALGCLLIGLFALVDHGRGRRHGWLHWTGLAVWLWISGWQHLAARV